MKLLCFLLALCNLALADRFFYGLNTFPKDRGVKCDWRLFDPSTNSEKVLISLPQGCPDSFFFDSETRKLYYVDGKRLIGANWDDFTKKESWPLPEGAEPGEGRSLFARLWRDKTTKKIRLGFFDEDPSRIITSLKSEEARTYSVSYKGKPVGEALELGVLGAAVSFEHDGSNWKLIEAKATNSGACDTLGLRVLTIQPSLSTQSDLLEKSELFACSGATDCTSKVASAELQKLIVAQFKDAGVYFLNLANGWSLVSAESSDSEYSYPGLPAFSYSPADKKLIPLNDLEKTGSYELKLSSDREWFSIQMSQAKRLFIYRYDNPKPRKAIEGLVTGAMWVKD